MSLANALEAEFRRTATARGRAGVGGFAIEGLRLFERAVAAGASVRGALLAESFGRQSAGDRESLLVNAIDRVGVPVARVPDSKLVALMEGRGGGAIVGVVDTPASRPLPATPAEWPGGDLLVGVDIEDPGNVGALLRTALAGGAAGYLRVGSGDPYHPKAVRTSMGSLYRLPIWTADSEAPSWIERLHACGLRLLGAATDGGVAPHQADFGHGGCAWIVGSEAFGLTASTLARMDGIVTIPMADSVDSYSVNASAAILLYESRRRRVSGSA